MRPNLSSSLPGSEDYKTSFEEYKLLLSWTNELASRRQETNNFFLAVSGAILTVLSLTLTGFQNIERAAAVVLFAIVGIVISVIWATLLEKYREILRFKYAQLELFEEELGLDTSGLVSAENRFFRYGEPLGIPGKTVDLELPSKVGTFGLTLTERKLPVLFGIVFGIVIVLSALDFIL